MATGKKSFVLYCDLSHTVNQLPNEKAGELFKHILAYVNDEDPQTDDLVLSIAFEPIKQQLKRDLVKYEVRADRARENGSKGGRPKNPKKPKETQSVILKPRKPDSVNDNVTVNVTDTDSKSTNTPTKVDGFEWSKLLAVINKAFCREFKTINKSVRDKYKARLKEGYTKEDIQNAINNCKLDTFHKDNNYKHCTPDYFSRANTLDLHSGSNKPKPYNPHT